MNEATELDSVISKNLEKQLAVYLRGDDQKRPFYGALSANCPNGRELVHAVSKASCRYLIPCIARHPQQQGTKPGPGTRGTGRLNISLHMQTLNLVEPRYPPGN